MEILTIKQMQYVKGGADAKKAMDAFIYSTTDDDDVPPKKD